MIVVPYGKDGKEIKPGSTKYIWDDKDKIDEYKERIKKAKLEIKRLPEGRKHITFLAKRGYNTPRPLNQRILYKETVANFRSDGYINWKPHLLSIQQGRIVTSNSEEIAFLDMKKDYMREKDRPLTQTEQDRAKNQELQVEITNLKKDLEDSKAGVPPEMSIQEKGIAKLKEIREKAKEEDVKS